VYVDFEFESKHIATFHGPVCQHVSQLMERRSVTYRQANEEVREQVV
jgi:hypothetical protein